MNLTISYEELNPDIQEAFLKEQIKNIGIDYQYNGIYGNIGEEEVCLFSFEKFFKADNRYCSYELIYDRLFILIKFNS
jgi:hypothetical protein